MTCRLKFQKSQIRKTHPTQVLLDQPDRVFSPSQETFHRDLSNGVECTIRATALCIEMRNNIGKYIFLMKTLQEREYPMI